MTWVNTGGAVSGGGVTNSPYASEAEVQALKTDILSGTIIYTTATRPAASATFADRVIRLLDAGASEQLQMCMVRSDGSTYEWVTIAQASA